MDVKIIFLLLMSVFLQTTYAYAQAGNSDRPTITSTNIEVNIPGKDAHIVTSHIENPAPNSDYETGELHIQYSDGSQVLVKLPVKQKSTAENIVYNQEGFADPKIAADKRTIAWTELVDNCCTSYAVPFALAIYQSGKTILHIQQGQMIWYWTFLDNDKQLGAVWGPTHGTEVGDYELYDTKTGKMIAEVYGDADSQSLGPDAPEWAKQLEQEMHSRK